MEGDDFGLNSQADFSPPAPPEPWSPSDDMRLMKLGQGLSHVREMEGSGMLHPEHAQELQQRIQEQMGPLAERKQQFEDYQQQQEDAKLLRASATQQSLLQANAQHDADNFLGRVRQYRDPITGQVATLYQTEPGKWSQMDLAPDTGEAPVGGMGAIGTTEGFGQGSGEGGPQTAPLEVWNGPNRTVAQFDAGGRMIGQPVQYDQFGNVVTPNQGGHITAEGFGIDPQTMGTLRGMAANAVAGIRPGPHRDVAFAHTLQGLVQKQLAYQLQERRQSQFAKQQAEHAQKMEEAKQKAETAKEERQWRKDAITDVNKEFAEARKAHAKDPEAKIPDYLATPEARAAEAKRRADETLAHMRPDSQQAKDKQQAGLGQYLSDREFVQQAGSATPPKTSAPTSVDEAKKNLEKINAIERKRAGEKAKAGAAMPQPQNPFFIPLS